MGDIFRARFVRGGMAMTGEVDPNLSKQDRMIAGFLGLGWIPALLGSGDIIVDGHKWYNFAVTAIGVVAYVASFGWPPSEGFFRRALTAFFVPLANNTKKIALGFALLGCLFLLSEISALRSDVDIYLMPRTLTKAQAAKITHYLKNKPSNSTLIVSSYDGDREAAEFAGGLFNAIKEAGWNPDITHYFPPPAGTPDDKLRSWPLEPANDGLCIDGGGEVGPGKNVQAAQTALYAALMEAGIEPNCSGGDPAHQSKLYLLVGHRPLKLNQGQPLLWRIGDWLERKASE